MVLWKGGKNSMKRFSIVLIYLSLLFQSGCASYPVKLEEVHIDYKNHAMVNPNNRSTLLYPEKIKETLNLGINTSSMGFLYNKNTVKSWTTEGQYRAVGLELEIGVRAANWIDIYYWHESLHLMDKAHSFLPRYPVSDAVGIRMYLYKRK